MVEKYLSETEIRKLLQCSRCKKCAAGPPVYTCKTGHLECNQCYSKFADGAKLDETEITTDSESDSATNRKDHTIGVIFPKESKCQNASNHPCSTCKEDVLKTRNLLAENLLALLESTKNYFQKNRNFEQQNCCYNIYGPRYETPNMAVAAYESQTYTRYQLPMQQYNYPFDPYGLEMQQYEYTDPNVFYPDYENSSYYNGYRREITEKKSRFNFGPRNSVLSLSQSGEPSKRPIRCPTHLCGRNIAVTALTSHFSFDHPDVPPVNVDFDVSSHLFVVPDVIPYNYGRCVAMLLIPNRFENLNSVSQSNLVSTKTKNPLPLVVMASRLDCVTNPQCANSTAPFDESNQAELNQGDYSTSETVKTQLLVIWLAGIETNSSIFTTLQVTEKQTNVRSVVYTGPVTSLRSSQNTTKVFEQGDCLVIQEGILENIVGDRGGFDLHVAVH